MVKNNLITKNIMKCLYICPVLFSYTNIILNSNTIYLYDISVIIFVLIFSYTVVFFVEFIIYSFLCKLMCTTHILSIIEYSHCSIIYICGVILIFLLLESQRKSFTEKFDM